MLIVKSDDDKALTITFDDMILISDLGKHYVCEW